MECILMQLINQKLTDSIVMVNMLHILFMGAKKTVKGFHTSSR